MWENCPWMDGDCRSEPPNSHWRKSWETETLPVRIQYFHCKCPQFYSTSYRSRAVLPPKCSVYRGADKSLARPGRKQANVSVRMAWISFGALPWRKKKNLITARVSMLLKSRASLTCFRVCFLPGRAKDLISTPVLAYPERLSNWSCINYLRPYSV